MFIKKPGLFSFLLGEKYTAVCNICKDNASDIDFLKDKYGFYGQYSDAQHLIRVCEECYKTGWKSKRNVKKTTSEYYRYECNVCEKVSKQESKLDTINTIHLCNTCYRKNGSSDFIHSYQYSHLGDASATCNNCKLIRIENGVESIYFEIGKTEPSKIAPSKCIKLQWIGRCEHNYLKAADFRKKQTEKISQKDADLANRNLKSKLDFLSDDPYPIITAQALSLSRNGYILEWCSKCGCTRQIP